MGELVFISYTLELSKVLKYSVRAAVLSVTLLLSMGQGLLRARESIVDTG